MPNLTPNFSLPYPAPSDEPCDFDEQWCDFTGAIDTVLAGFQETADRTNPVIPIAVVELTTPTTVSSLSNVPFDTVIVDTASMTDMDVDPFGITINRAGRYTVAGGMQAVTASPPFPPGFFGITISGGFSVNAETYDFAIPGLDLGVTTERPVVGLVPGNQIRMTFTFGVVANHLINQAWLAVAWHSDAERPS